MHETFNFGKKGKYLLESLIIIEIMKIRLSVVKNGQDITHMFDIIADSMNSYGDVGIYFDKLQNEEELIKFLNKHKLKYNKYGNLYVVPTPRVIIECADNMLSISEIKAALKKNKEADKLGCRLYWKYRELGVYDKFADLCDKYTSPDLHRYDMYLKVQEELDKIVISSGKRL